MNQWKPCTPLAVAVVWEDVIVAEDFTFAASSVMGDDVTGLGFPTCDAVDALTFSRLGHWRPAPVLRCRARFVPRGLPLNVEGSA